MRSLRTAFGLALACSIVRHVAAFNPHAYTQKVVTCPAVNRKENKEVDIQIHYVDVNPRAPKTLLMVHGWPSLWSSWSNQIDEFGKDHRILAPDHRGFGASTHPGDVHSSGTMPDLVGDMTCVLAHAGVSKAICVGHDWGAQVCWEAARQRPDIFDAVVAAVVPYIPSAGPFVPISSLVPHLPKLAYQLFFQDNTPAAVQELDRDIRRTLRATLRGVDSPPPDKFLKSTESFLIGWEDVKEIPPIPFFTPEEEDYFVEQYAIQGFKNTLEFYTAGNRFGSWHFAHDQGNFTISQPALTIFPTKDPVADWEKAAQLLGSAKFIPNWHVELVRAAHWPQLDAPQAFNTAMRRWLEALPETHGISEPADTEQWRAYDEL